MTQSIHTYAVRFHGGPAGSGQGIRAQIHLFGADRHMLGYVDFYDSGANLPEDILQDNIITLSLYITELPAVVDILRNEEPVYIAWQENLRNAYIGTSQERVGEGE